MTRVLPALLAAAALALPATALAGGETKAGGSIWSDADGDGVHDSQDLCDGSDDTVDLDADGTADCSQSFLGTGPFDSSSDVAAWWFDGSFDSTDAEGYAGSGSMDLGTGWFATAASMSPCVAVDPSTPHELLLQVDVANATANPNLYVQVWEDTQSDCSGSTLGQTTLDQVLADTGGWTVIGGRFTTSSQTRGVQVFVANLRPQNATTETEAWLDNVLLHDDISGSSSDTGSESRD